MCHLDLELEAQVNSEYGLKNDLNNFVKQVFWDCLCSQLPEELFDLTY
jgi:hypothetical protein